MEGWQERMGSPNLGREISGKEKATFSNAACEERKSGGRGTAMTGLVTESFSGVVAKAASQWGKGLMDNGSGGWYCGLCPLRVTVRDQGAQSGGGLLESALGTRMREGGRQDWAAGGSEL